MPKNPVIADVFMQIGLAEELGSGVRNLIKYTKLYSGGEPTFNDGLVFTAFVPIREQKNMGGVTVEQSSVKPIGVAGGIEGAIEHLLSVQDEVTIAQIAELCGANVRAVRRKVARMVEQGELVALGKTRRRRYARAEKSAGAASD